MTVCAAWAPDLGRQGRLVRGIGKKRLVACGLWCALSLRRGGPVCPPALRGDVGAPVAIVRETKPPPLGGQLPLHQWGARCSKYATSRPWQDVNLKW